MRLNNPTERIPRPQSPESLHGQNATTSQSISATEFDEMKKSIQEIHAALLLSPSHQISIRQDEGNRPPSSTTIPSPFIAEPPPTIVMPETGRRRVPHLGPVVILSRTPSTRSRPSNPSPTIVPGSEPGYFGRTVFTNRTDATAHELGSVINDFSSIVIIATFLASVSIVMLALARAVVDSPHVPTTPMSKTLHIILQVFGCISLSFNLAVVIVAGGAASSQSLRLRLGQRASEFTRAQSLNVKLQLCSTLQYYGLLALTVAIACLFGVLLNSPFSTLLIVPVLGVIFYDSLFRGKV
ncbi:hypothetical protein BYT27DRAFT_7205231, partial [Phlegmacium glaucopus]